MKKITPYLVVLFVLLNVSCSKKCVDFAPEDTEISWSDYNEVDAVLRYFNNHCGTIMTHQKDTIRVCGYMAMYTAECLRNQDLPTDFFLKRNKNSSGGANGLPIYLLMHSSWADGWEEKKEELISFADEKIYVLGEVSYDQFYDMGVDGCCNLTMVVNAIEISTNPIK